MTVWEEYQGDGTVKVRWLLPLLLSLVLHLVLLQMLVPAREALPPQIAGSTLVTVTLTGSEQAMPAPAATVPESGPPSVPPAEQLLPEEPGRRPEKKVFPTLRPEPGKIKKTLQVNMESASWPLPEVPLPAGAHRPAVVAEPEGGETSVLGSGATDPAATTTVLQQAVPLAVDNRPPDYPALARKRGWEGKVLLEVAVASDGGVQEVRVQNGSNHDLLDEAALRAVREWRFQPGTRDGKPVAMQVLVPVHFILQDNS